MGNLSEAEADMTAESLKVFCIWMSGFLRKTSFVWVTASSVFAVCGAQAPSLNGDPPAVLSQTLQGVTVKVTNVRWSIAKWDAADTAIDKTLDVKYRIEMAALVPLPPDKKPADYVKTITAVSPEGFSLGGASGRGFGRAEWNDIDPRLPWIGLDIEFLDPSATPREAGQYAGPVAITDIPVPGRLNAAVPVHAETITPLGTQVIVEKVEILPGAAGNETKLTVHVVPDQDASDLQFSYSTGTQLHDDTGANLSGYGTSNGNNAGSPYRTVLVHSAPKPGAKRMTLTLDVNESSERLRQNAEYRHFQLRVPLNSLKPGRKYAAVPLASVQGKELAATLDSVEVQWGCYQARIVVHDQHDPTITWRLHTVRGTTEAGNPLRKTYGSNTFFWKSDGSPLADGETGWEVALNTPGQEREDIDAAPPPAKTLLLTADFRAYRQQSYFIDCSNLPVPEPGQTVTLNRTIQDASGASVIVRKVEAYSLTYPLPRGSEKQGHLTFTASPSGLVVVLAEPNSLKPKKDFDYDIVTANDPSGTSLLSTRSMKFAPGDALLSTSLPPPDNLAQVETVYLQPPAPEARTFDLRLYHETALRLDQNEALTFPAVPAPVAAKSK